MELNVLQKISYGMYIIGARKGEAINAQTANTVMQISSDPLSVAVAINKDNLTHEYIKEGQRFSISVLEQETPLSLIGTFGFRSGRDINKFENINYALTEQGLPYVTDHALAYLEAEVIGEMDASTHTVFLGRVTGAKVLKEGDPLTYAYYHRVKRGTTPPSASTYVPDEKAQESSSGDPGGSDGSGDPGGSGGETDKYVCRVCGYVYDPEAGDPENNILPGTTFGELPEDWVCPICGAGKDAFEKES